ncbi:bile acid:sodium symporter family protein [Pseudoduganella lutea]|uniref:Bile acid:sodium symporter n=1 Tax=Pseudoduganella lutea TaxID=321985 RepID=A0A4P6L204_9BURK|nr:bile acid:sodium symporter family protein [Pseudoduganella lutea]QBE65417.1 bile acid:sodium symporter [Pseudoduganella lutea]
MKLPRPSFKVDRFKVDRFTLAMLATVTIASFLPCSGTAAQAFGHVTHAAVCLLFFLHGARLPREAVMAGVVHWRLHLTVLLCTFLLFPLLGLALRPALEPLMTPELYVGILFLCMLPSTVQSSIAFTAAARGNVPAAICSASASNLLGIALTPVLVGLFVAGHAAGGGMGDAALKIALQLLLPFAAGQAARRWIGPWVVRHPKLARAVDQGAILLVVYTAFSEAVVQGVWTRLTPGALAGLLLVNMVLLALVLGTTAWLGRRLGFDRADRIAIVFCGSKKSLASGVPMAKVLFAGGALGGVILPLMLFHQLQLMACAVLAQRYAAAGGKAPVNS